MTSRDPAADGFGAETYYGQDFLYKTPSGRTFVLSVPYPFAGKQDAGKHFVTAKAELHRYAQLPRALALIQHFECELFENAVVPVALAHRYTAISLGARRTGTRSPDAHGPPVNRCAMAELASTRLGGGVA